MLIVNADDLGRDSSATDAILACFKTGGITSATAMVWMSDSPRAAELSADTDLPVGLHLNLTEPYTGAGVPSAARDRQAKLARYFGTRARWIYNPLLQRAVEDSIADQLEQFGLLWGWAPTHIDGHHHIQSAPNVAIARALPKGAKVRRGLTFFAQEKWAMNRLVRAAIDAVLTRRFECPRFLFSIRSHQRLGGTGIDDKIRLAYREPVEVVCHPALADEYQLLRSRDWTTELTSLPSGSYRDL